MTKRLTDNLAEIFKRSGNMANSLSNSLDMQMDRLEEKKLLELYNSMNNVMDTELGCLMKQAKDKR